MGYGSNPIIKIDYKDIQDKVSEHTTQLADIVSIRSQGIKGGVDETDAFLTAVTTLASQNKIILIPHDLTIMTSGITLSNLSNFGILCYGTIKRINSAGNTSILTFSNCSNVDIPLLNTDGNVSGNGGTVNQNQQSVTINNGSGNINFGIFNDHNPSGDTVYINNATNITFDVLRSLSDSATGRNGLTVIQGSNIFVDKLISLNTGYPGMPGGFDIEPNLSSNTVSNIKINYALITTSGTNGIQVANYNGASVTNIDINGFVTKNSANTSNFPLAINSVVGFKGNIKIKQTGTPSDAVLINNSSDIDLFIDSDNSQRGISFQGTTQDVTVKGIITNTQIEGIGINGTFTNILFDMTIRDVGKSGSGSVVYCNSSSTAQNIKFRGNFSKGTYGHSCFRFEGTISNLRAENLDMTGWPDSYRVYGANAGAGGFFAVNCPNYNYRSTLPAGIDGYTQGVIVWNTGATAGGKIGWVVTASGKPGTIKPFGAIDA